MKPTMTTLSSKGKAALRNAAQRLKPAIHVGKNGLTPALVAELEKALAAEQLVKVAYKATRDEIDALVAETESKAAAECVGGVGKRRSFYKPAAAPDA